MWLKSNFLLLFVSLIMLGLFANCGGKGSNVDLSGETSTLNDQGGGEENEESNSNFTSETVEDEEVVQTEEDGDEGDSNEEIVVDAPELGYVTDSLVYIDCADKTEAGDPALDYVALSCTQNETTITYYYYCTASTDEEDNEIFIVTRDTDDDPAITEDFFETILVTCQEAEDGSPELFEEEYIVS